MLVRKCDKCKAVGEPNNLVRSKFSITYSREENMAEDWEKPYFEFVDRTERFDLCEKCSKEIYKIIKGVEPPLKIL